MKLLNSSKLLTAACALSLAMGVVGTVHATHKGPEHGPGNSNKGKGPQLSIDVETFCGIPLRVPALDENGEIKKDADGKIIYDEFTGPENVAVRVTNVSDDNELVDPQINSVHIMCHTAKGKPGGSENPREVFSDELINTDTYFGDYFYQCDFTDDRLSDDATEWKATAVVNFDKGGQATQVFDSCGEVPVP